MFGFHTRHNDINNVYKWKQTGNVIKPNLKKKQQVNIE